MNTLIKERRAGFPLFRINEFQTKIPEGFSVNDAPPFTPRRFIDHLNKQSTSESVLSQNAGKVVRIQVSALSEKTYGINLPEIIKARRGLPIGALGLLFVLKHHPNILSEHSWIVSPESSSELAVPCMINHFERGHDFQAFDPRNMFPNWIHLVFIVE